MIYPLIFIFQTNDNATPTITTTPSNTTTTTTVVANKSPSTVPAVTITKTANENGSNSLQDKRRRLQASLKQKKLDKKRSMGLIPSDPHPSSIEFMRSLNPIPKKKKRSLSPIPHDNSVSSGPPPAKIPPTVISVLESIKEDDNNNRVCYYAVMLS